MYEWQIDRYAWTYTATEHPCPECGQGLTRVDDSTMLVCSAKHGPFFLV